MKAKEIIVGLLSYIDELTVYNAIEKPEFNDTTIESIERYKNSLPEIYYIAKFFIEPKIKHFK